MTTNVRPRFYLDIAEVIVWLTEHTDAQIATRWAEALWTTVSQIEKFPLLGRLRADLPFSAVRTWRVGGFEKWLIFYGVRGTTLVLYRVRHGATNLMKIDINS